METSDIVILTIILIILQQSVAACPALRPFGTLKLIWMSKMGYEAFYLNLHSTVQSTTLPNTCVVAP